MGVFTHIWSVRRGVAVCKVGLPLMAVGHALLMVKGHPVTN